MDWFSDAKEDSVKIEGIERDSVHSYVVTATIRTRSELSIRNLMAFRLLRHFRRLRTIMGLLRRFR